MMKTWRWLSVSGAVVFLSVVACSSSSGGGGSGGSGGANSCNDMTGTWSMSGDCPSGPSSCVVTQNGCSAQLACDSGNATASVNGNQMTFSFGTAQCNGTVTNGAFSGTCTASGSTCSVSGSCNGGSCGSTTVTGGSGGGSGGTGPGTGGTGGGTGGSGGGGSCGDVSYSSDSVCQGCMESACCSQLANCSSGTPCYELLACFESNCANSTDFETCMNQFCSSELVSGGPAVVALDECDNANCSAQCAANSGSGSGGGEL